MEKRNGDEIVPREQAEILEYEGDPLADGDDGLREFYEDQIEEGKSNGS